MLTPLNVPDDQKALADGCKALADGNEDAAFTHLQNATHLADEISLEIVIVHKQHVRIVARRPIGVFDVEE